MFIGLNGAKKSGKSTLANFLAKKYQFKVVTFAEPLKNGLCVMTRQHYDNFELQSLKDQVHPVKLLTQANIADFLEYISKTYIPIESGLISGITLQFEGTEYESNRQLMQKMGTELVRQNVSDSYWIDCARLDVAKSRSNKVVFSDARFSNERALVKEMGGKNVLVTRDMINDGDKHTSESIGDDTEYDVIVTNDSTIRVLEEQFDLWYTIRRR